MAVQRPAGRLNRLVSLALALHISLIDHLGSTTIHPTYLSIPSHSKAFVSDLPRRFRRHYVPGGHPISRYRELAGTYTHLS